MKQLEMIELIKHSLLKGDYSQAEAFLNQLELSGLHSAELSYLKACLFQEQNDFKQAEQSYKDSLKKDSHYVPSLRNLSILYNDVGDYKNGEIYFKKTLAAQQLEDKKQTSKDHIIQKDLSQKHFEMAELYLKDDSWKEALVELEACLKNNPKYEKAVIELALCLKKLGFLEKAIRRLEIFVSEHESIAVASRICLGDLLCEKGLFQEGVRQWEKAAQINSSVKEVKEKLKDYSSLPSKENLILD